jgi:PAS domain S-box-containing protein
MLAEQIDFHRMYKIGPTAMALVTSDLVVIDANEEFEEYAGRPLEEVVGRNIFEVMPKVPLDPGGDPMWTPLEEAMTSGRREVTRLMRYDLEDPHEPGAFVEHWWAAIAQPLLGLAGKVEVIEVSFRDVTPIISQYQTMQADRSRSAE